LLQVQIPLHLPCVNFAHVAVAPLPGLLDDKV